MDQGVGYKAREQVKQAVRAGGRKDDSHAWILTERSPTTNLPVSAKTISRESLTKTSEHPLIVKSAITIAKRNLAECAGEYHAGVWPRSTLRISEINLAGLNGLLRKHSTPKSDNALRKQ